MFQVGRGEQGDLEPFGGIGPSDVEALDEVGLALAVPGEDQAHPAADLSGLGAPEEGPEHPVGMRVWHRIPVVEPLADRPVVHVVADVVEVVGDQGVDGPAERGGPLLGRVEEGDMIADDPEQGGEAVFAPGGGLGDGPHLRPVVGPFRGRRDVGPHAGLALAGRVARLLRLLLGGLMGLGEGLEATFGRDRTGRRRPLPTGGVGEGLAAEPVVGGDVGELGGHSGVGPVDSRRIAATSARLRAW